jgi:hypothetical protein
LWILFDEFIKKRKKRKEDYTCWIYKYINWSSSTNISRKEKENFARFNRSFFCFSLLEYFDDLTYLYDLDHWCLFAHFIRRRLVLNRFYFDSNLDSMWKKWWRKSFYSILVNNLIDNHLWRTLNADSSTRLCQKYRW